MVVLGNPPYSGNSANKGEWIRQLIETYKMVDGKPLGEKTPRCCKTTMLNLFASGSGALRKQAGILGLLQSRIYR